MEKGEISSLSIVVNQVKGYNEIVSERDLIGKAQRKAGDFAWK